MKRKHHNALCLSGLLRDKIEKIIEMENKKRLSIVEDIDPEIVYVKEG